MNFLEQDLEEIIYTGDFEELEERGIYIPGILRRQVKIGNYGIADLISIIRPYYNSDGYREKGTIIIYELKRKKIDVNAFLQALRYAKGIKRYLEKKGYEYRYNLEIVLIGKEIDTVSPFCFLPDFIEQDDFHLSMYTYSYDIDGIQFKNESGYRLAEEGF